MRDFRLLGHQHDVVLPPHRFGQSLVRCGIVWLPKEGVKHHEGATIICQPIQQLGVQSPVPRLVADLVKIIIRFVVHQDEGHPVGDRVRAEAEQIIIAGVHPGLAQRHLPQHETVKHHRRRPQRGFKKIMLSDGFDLHLWLSLEKGGGEISDFSPDQLKRGK